MLRGLVRTSVQTTSFPAAKGPVKVAVNLAFRGQFTVLRSFSDAAAPAKPKLRLGKPGNNVKIGIVGMPNIGKSTMFNCLSMQSVPAENFPFCTIDPNHAVVEVPDPRLRWLKQAFGSKQSLPALLSITDIAGLVKGASEGKGLGNEFLAHIGAVDAIFHLVRVFKNPGAGESGRTIEHVEGSVDPVRDMEIISKELLLKDAQRIKERLDKVGKLAGRSSNPQHAQQVVTFKKAAALIDSNKDIREGDWDAADVEVLNELGLLTAKPIVYLLNASAEDYLKGANPHMETARAWIAKRSPGAPSILFSGDWEADLQLVEPADKADYIKDALEGLGLPAPASEEEVLATEDAAARGVFPPEVAETPLIAGTELAYLQQMALASALKRKTMLPTIITSGYRALGLIHYFTCGEEEARAWTIKQGTTAPGAAGVIHTDFEKKTISYADMREYGGEQQAKKAGKMKTQGKTYVVQDGDCMLFKHTAGKK